MKKLFLWILWALFVVWVFSMIATDVAELVSMDVPKTIKNIFIYIFETLMWAVGALVVYAILGAIFWFEKEPNKKKNSESGSNQARSAHSLKKNNVTSNVWLNSIWMGEKSLSETFWLYYLLINGTASYAIATLFMEKHMWVFFIILAANIFTSVAVWRSASNYKLIQVKKKNSNIWGILAKISVGLNFFQLGSSAILLLSII